MRRARLEVRQYYGASTNSETWQRRGFSSLFGIVYVCCEIQHWQSPQLQGFLKILSCCKVNFDGSAGAMEPAGILKLFAVS